MRRQMTVPRTTIVDKEEDEPMCSIECCNNISMKLQEQMAQQEEEITALKQIIDSKNVEINDLKTSEAGIHAQYINIMSQLKKCQI